MGQTQSMVPLIYAASDRHGVYVQDPIWHPLVPEAAQNKLIKLYVEYCKDMVKEVHKYTNGLESFFQQELFARQFDGDAPIPDDIKGRWLEASVATQKEMMIKQSDMATKRYRDAAAAVLVEVKGKEYGMKYKNDHEAQRLVLQDYYAAKPNHELKATYGEEHKFHHAALSVLNDPKPSRKLTSQERADVKLLADLHSLDRAELQKCQDISEIAATKPDLARQMAKHMDNEVYDPIMRTVLLGVNRDTRFKIHQLVLIHAVQPAKKKPFFSEYVKTSSKRMVLLQGVLGEFTKKRQEVLEAAGVTEEKRKLREHGTYTLMGQLY